MGAEIPLLREPSGVVCARVEDLEGEGKAEGEGQGESGGKLVTGEGWG